jgi:hypothetical protein
VLATPGLRWQCVSPALLSKLLKQGHMHKLAATLGSAKTGSAWLGGCSSPPQRYDKWLTLGCPGVTQRYGRVYPARSKQNQPHGCSSSTQSTHKTLLAQDVPACLGCADAHSQQTDRQQSALPAIASCTGTGVAPAILSNAAAHSRSSESADPNTSLQLVSVFHTVDNQRPCRLTTRPRNTGTQRAAPTCTVDASTPSHTLLQAR